MTSINISLPFKRAFLPLALSFVENGSSGFGYSPAVTNRLLLAAEELFMFYVRQSVQGATAEMTLTDRGYKLVFRFAFTNKNPDFRSLNMIWKFEEDDDSLSLLGPMLAARSVSELSLGFAENEQVIITADIYKEYAPTEKIAPSAPAAGGFTLKTPSADDVGYFIKTLLSTGGFLLPDFLSNAEMASDIFAGGDMEAVIAESSGQIAGGVFLRKISDSLWEVFGPYVLRDEKETADSLMNELISRCSRGSVKGLLRRQDVMDGYEKYFDLLGEISLNSGGKKTYYHRQMEEEYGSAVYCGSGLAKFLNTQYDKLALLRNIREKVLKTDTLRDSSVLMPSVEYGAGVAVLKVLCAGKDMTENLNAHTAMLKNQGINDIIMEINTAKNEDILFAEVMADCGFTPLLLIPDGKNGDTAVYKYFGESAI